MLTNCSFFWTSLDVDDCCNSISPHHFPASVSIYACHLTPSPSLHRFPSTIILLSGNNLLLSTLFPSLLFILRFAVFIGGRAVRIDCIECNVTRIPRFSLDISICLELLLSATRCLQYSCPLDLGYCVDDNVEIHRSSPGGRAFSESIDRNGGGT